MSYLYKTKIVQLKDGGNVEVPTFKEYTLLRGKQYYTSLTENYLNVTDNGVYRVYSTRMQVILETKSKFKAFRYFINMTKKGYYSRFKK